MKPNNILKKILLSLFFLFNNNVLPIVICTAIDEIYFDHVVNLIGSIHKTNINPTILVYNLGMTSEQIDYLNSIENVQVCQVEQVHKDLLKFVRIDVHGKVVRGWYAFKPVIIKQALDKYDECLYLDAGNTVLGDLSQLYEYIKQNGYFIINGFQNIRDWVTTRVVTHFDLKSDKNKFVLDANTKSISANIIGISKKYYGNLVLPMYNHAKELTLFEDDGTANGGFGKHRHDQILWSIYARLLQLNTFEQGFISLNINDQKYTFHTHFEESEINSKTLIYQSRWNIKYENGQPYYQKFIRFKSKTVDQQDELDKTDLVIFSYDRPLQLFALLESTKQYIKGIDKVNIIYRCSNDKFEESYNECFETFKDFNFNLIKQDHNNPTQLIKSHVINAIRATKNRYVMFAVDDIIVKDYVNLNECIELLQKTGAYGFYLRLGKNICQCYTEGIESPMPSCDYVEKDIYLTHFDGKGDWAYPCSLDMVLYKKDKILESIYKTHFNTPNRFEGNWHVNESHNNPIKDKTGLFYECSKIVNIPLNMVQTDGYSKNLELSTQDLLQKFEQGYKINIEQFFKINNKAPHMEFNVSFILRDAPLDLDELRSVLKELDINKIERLKDKHNRFLKNKKTDIYNIKDENGYTPLMWACNCQLPEVTQFLIQNGADVNAKDKNEFTALMFACWRGNYDIVKILLENNADKDMIDINGTTALSITAENQNPDQDKIINLILES